MCLIHGAVVRQAPLLPVLHGEKVALFAPDEGRPRGRTVRQRLYPLAPHSPHQARSQPPPLTDRVALAAKRRLRDAVSPPREKRGEEELATVASGKRDDNRHYRRLLRPVNPARVATLLGVVRVNVSNCRISKEPSDDNLDVLARSNVRIQQKACLVKRAER